MILQTAFLSVLLCFSNAFTIEASFEKSDENSGNNIVDEEFTVSALLEKANANLGKNLDDPLVMFGDIVMPTGLQNADPCTARDCLWPKSNDGNVYVPFRISRQYSQRERQVIMDGLRSFEQSTCIRFRPARRRTDRHFLDIQSRGGCFSYVGRQNGGQVLSLAQQGCVFPQVVQHEVLHALGFHHEQSRSDRDRHVLIQLENIIPEFKFAFDRVDTNNLGTPYDYDSVMHYDRFAFSRNGEPTIVPIPDENVSIGRATQMSPNDILRVNRLYGCNSTALNPEQRYKLFLTRKGSRLMQLFI